MRTVIFSTLGVAGTFVFRDLQTGEQIDAVNGVSRVDFHPILAGSGRWTAKITYVGVDGHECRTEHVYLITAAVP